MDSQAIRFGILTVSDRCSAGEAEDKSGPALESCIKSYKGFSGIVSKKDCVPDNVLDIKDKLIAWCDSESGNCDVILTSGGTGFSNRDITPEATAMVITKRCDALAMMGAIRSSSPFAFLSRAAAGIRENTLIVNLPGSVRGAVECFEIIAPLLSHAVHLIVGNITAVSNTHSMNLTELTPTIFMNSLDINHHHHHHHFNGFHHHDQPSLKFNHTSTISSVGVVKSGLRARVSPWPMINLADAQKIVLEVASKVSPHIDEVPLMESLGRIGANCSSGLDLPPFRASVKDGYAVKVSDGVSSRKVVSTSSAGDQTQDFVLKQGECVRVNTGAPIPPGADAVVQVEDTKVLSMNNESEEVEIEILIAPTVGQDIREIGSDMKSTTQIVTSGDIITSSLIGVLASSGFKRVCCWSVNVCVYSTGDELMDINQKLENGKIYDANRYTLMSLLKENSFQATDGGIIRDDPNEIYKRLSEGLKSNDVIITTGSVSMGDKDYLKLVLTADIKATIHFGRIDLKPGKPTTFASVRLENGDEKLIFSLPGNPVSAAVTTHLLVLPALRKIAKHRQLFSPTIKVQATQDIRFDDTRKEYKRANVTYVPSGLPFATPCGNQASSRLGSMAESNALITCEPGSTVPEGSTLEALLIGPMKF